VEFHPIDWRAPIPQGVPPAPLEFLVNLFTRQRRYTSYLPRLAWNFGAPVCPFADRRLIVMALHAERSQLASLSVHRQMLINEFPDLARIPCANDGLPPGSRKRRLARDMLRRSGIGRWVRSVWPGTRKNYDYSKLYPLASEVSTLVRIRTGREFPAGLGAMAQLALGPILLGSPGEAVDAILDLIRTGAKK